MREQVASLCKFVLFSSGLRPQLLVQDDEVQVIPQRLSVDEVRIRERPRLGRSRVPSALVPGEQLLARPDDRHFHLCRAQLLTGILFSVLQHQTANAAALTLRVDSEQAQVTQTVLLAGDFAAGRELAVVVVGQQDGRARGVDLGGHAVGIDAVVADQVGFGGPALARGVAAESLLDEGGDGGRVGRGGFAVGEADHTVFVVGNGIVEAVLFLCCFRACKRLVGLNASLTDQFCL